MFGYIKPFTPELRVCEYEFYRSVYCGLCRTMGQCTGCLSRMTLSYDFVFLSILRMALEKTPVSISQHRCAAHITRKRSVTDTNPALEFCANACAVLTFGKVKDDVRDCRGFKKLCAMSLLPSASAMKRRADSKIHGLSESVSEHLNRLCETEDLNKESIDCGADIFGALLSDVASFGIENSAERRIAAEIGRSTGRWIYVTDAVDDIKNDAESGNYNPVIAVYGKNPSKDELYSIKTALILELSRLEAAVNLIDFSGNEILGNIIKNIIYLGMPKVSEDVISTAINGGHTKRKAHRQKNPVSDVTYE